MRIFATLGLKFFRHASRLALGAGLVTATLAGAATFTVTNTADSGAGSLRQALLDANSNCGSAPHTISFNIVGAGPHGINLASALPPLACQMTVDGYTQPQYTSAAPASMNTDAGASNNANLLIVLNGGSCAACNGLTLNGTSIVIRGLVIRSFPAAGIRISAGADFAVIEGNYIGTDAGGMTAFGNQDGIFIDNANNVTIGGSSAGSRNLITGNTDAGIDAPGTSISGLIVRNNQLGGNRSGGSSIGNAGSGIYSYSNVAAANNVRIDGNWVTGNYEGIYVRRFTAVENNKVHGNTFIGVTLFFDNNTSKSNEIYNNGSDGIWITDANNQVESSVVYNNTGYGINVWFGPTTILNSTVFGNTGGGINMDTTQPISIIGTRSYGNNGHSGIMVDDTDITTNDYSATAPSPPHDADVTGTVNGPQNHPEITSVVQSGGNTTVSGFLRTNGLSQSYRIELFSNSVAALRQGEVAEDSFLASTDANGELTFSRVLTGLKTHVTATATRQSAPIETSQFSPAIAASAGGPVFSPSSTSLSFGNIALGLSSASQNFTITNTGGTTLTLISGTGPTGDFAKTGTCPASLAPAASCVLSLTFTPTALGARAGTLTITTDAPGSPHVINLSGTGVAAGLEPTVSFSPTSVMAGVASTLSITISNSSATAATVNPVAFTYPAGLTNAAVTNVTSTCGGTPTATAGGNAVGFATAFVVASSGSCTLSVSVLSTAAASYTVNATAGSITSSIGSNTLTASASLTVTPALTLPTLAVAFAPTNVVTSAPSVLTLTFTNPNTIAVTLSAFTVTYPPGLVNTASPTPASTCAGATPAAIAGMPDLIQANAGVTLAPSASCQFTVNVTSATAGSYSLSVAAGAVSSDAGSLAASNFATLLVGLPPPTATLTPASLAFGSVTVGSNSAPQALLLTNTSTTTPLSISSVSASGPYGFAAGTTCAVGVPLPALGTCVVEVQFNPLVVGTVAGTVSVVTNGGSFSTTLSGTGLPLPAPNITFSPATLAFGAVPPGTTSAAQTVTMSNTGTAPLSVSSMIATPPYGIVLSAALPALAPPPTEAKRAKVSFACPTGPFSLSPGSECTFGVTFSPTVSGEQGGAIIVTNSGATLTLALTGAGGVGKAISATPPSVDFGAVVFGQSGTPRVVTLTSTGFEPVTIAAVRIVPGIGAAAGEAADFSVSHNCTTLAPQPATGCTATVGFRPTAIGPRASDLQITGDFNGGTLLIPLDGAGTPSTVPLLSFSASRFGFGQSAIGSGRPVSMTVSNAGQLPVRIFAIRPQGDFNVRHDCPAVLAVGSVCTVSPASLPMVPGLRLGTLVIESDARDSPATFPLEAFGCRLFSMRDARTGSGFCTP